MDKKEFIIKLNDEIDYAKFSLKQKSVVDAKKASQRAQELLDQYFCRITGFTFLDNVKFQKKINKVKNKIGG